MSLSGESTRVRVTLRGGVGHSAADYARAKVEQALDVAPGWVLEAHVVLDHGEDPAVPRPARAEATVDVDGSAVRAHATARTMGEAVDEMEGRLRRQLVRVRERSRTRHRWTGLAAEHEWRHGDRRREPVPYYPRPVESRQVVRHKTFAVAPMTIDEAAFELDLLDHDFYLFTDLGSGEPAVVSRTPEGQYAVQGATNGGAVASVALRPRPPALTDAEARTRLDVGQEPHVFYLDRDTGQGRVLYRRYDGHYGLIAEA